MLFGVEVLDSLKIEERISGFLIVVLIGLGHEDEALGSSLGEVVGGGDVKHDRDGEEQAELPAE